MSTARPPGGAVAVTRERGLGRIFAGLLPFNIATQVASFAAWVAFAHVLGASTETDAYLLALAVPAVVYGILLSGVYFGAIPSLTEERAQDKSGKSPAANALISATLAGSMAVTVVVTLLALVLVPLALRSNASLVFQTRLMIVELSPLGVLGACIGALSALLSVRGKFIPAVAVTAFDPLLRTGFVIAWGHSLGVQALVLANLIGAGAAVATLAWMARRVGYRLSLVRPTATPFVRSVGRAAIPLVIASSVLQGNPLIDRIMAGGLGAGSVTVLDLGWRLVPTGLLIGLAVSPLTATWAGRKASGGWPALEKSVVRALSTAAVVVPPLAVLGILLRSELVTFAYHGGAYSDHAASQTSTVFGLFLIALPAEAFSLIFSTLFLVQGKTRISMWLGFANVVLNVTLNFALRPIWGVAGIALSTSLTLAILNVVQAGITHRRWGRSVAYPPLGLLARIAAALGVATVVAAVALRSLPAVDSRLAALLVTVAVGGVGLVSYAVTLLGSLRIGSRVPRSLRLPLRVGS